MVHHIPNQTPEVFHITEAEENVGHCVIRNLKKNLRRKKACAFSQAPKGKNLLKDEKPVSAALCVRRRTGEVVIKAQKVILCTGGFAGNDEMVENITRDLSVNW